MPTIPPFNGSRTGEFAQQIAKDFRACIGYNRSGDHDSRAANLFGQLMSGAAVNWYVSLDVETRGSFLRLEKAFLDRFDINEGVLGKTTQVDRLLRFNTHLGPSIAKLRREEVWVAWLQRLSELVGNITAEFACPQALAFTAWSLLPREIRDVVARPHEDDTVAEFVTSCSSVPRASFERILADFDVKVSSPQLNLQGSDSD